MSNSDSKGDQVVKFPLMSAALGYTRIHEDELGAGFHWASRPAANIHRTGCPPSTPKERNLAQRAFLDLAPPVRVTLQPYRVLTNN